MRVINQSTLPSGLKVSLLSWNGKYLVKLENGQLEQIYKISETDVAGVSEVENLVKQSDFEKKALDIFAQMEANLEPLW